MMLQVVGISPPPGMMPVTSGGDLYQGRGRVITITGRTDPAQCKRAVAGFTFVAFKSNYSYCRGSVDAPYGCKNGLQ